MKPLRKLLYRRHQGAAFITSLVFVLVFSALAVSMATLSGTNLQIAENQRKGDCARACAESGLDIIRFWLSRFSVDGTTDPSVVISALRTSLQNDFTDNNITNITTEYDSSTITIPGVILSSDKGFMAEISQLDADTLQLDVTGMYGSVSRTIRANYDFGVRRKTVFDYGVATKGPLHLAGNILLEGVNVSVESDVYIVSENDNIAMEIVGNSAIAGDVHICSSTATVDMQGGQASIGGETAPEAYDHVINGMDPVEFPAPNPGYFVHYATNIVDSSTDFTAEATYDNIKIVSGTNPTFSNNVTLRGIVFIETPNVVTFTGNTTITGIIVGGGYYEDDSGTNQINFIGNVDSQDVNTLPDEPQFLGIKNETGTFLMAPGFQVSFGGNFSTLNGAIAANGIKFWGNAGGIIEGSVLNYSDTPMEMSGNSDLFFNRSADTEIPVGFIPDIILDYDPSSYSEVVF